MLRPTEAAQDHRRPVVQRRQRRRIAKRRRRDKARWRCATAAFPRRRTLPVRSSTEPRRLDARRDKFNRSRLRAQPRPRPIDRGSAMRYARPAPGRCGPARRSSNSKRSPQATAVRGARASGSHGVCKARQSVGEAARRVAGVHQPVRLPLRVVELGDDVAGDCRLPAQRLDLSLEPAKLLLLRRVDEAVEIAEHGGEAGVAKPRLDPMRIGGAAVPIVAALEPPGLRPVLLQDVAHMRQAPDAELRADKRFVAAPFGVAMRRPREGGPARELRRRRLKFVRLMRESRCTSGSPRYRSSRGSCAGSRASCRPRANPAPPASPHRRMS